MKNSKRAKIILTTLSPNSHRTAEENLGIGYLTTSLRKNGFSVEIIDGWLEGLSDNEVYEKIIADTSVGIVGVSCYMSNNDSSIELARKIKKALPEVHLICGGFGPTFTPNKFLSKDTFEVAMIGEGEKTIIEVCSNLLCRKSLRKVKGIVYLENEKVIKNEVNDQVLDLDTLEVPVRDTLKFAISRKSTVNILTSRGCMGNCTFCSVNAFWKLSKGKKWRGRSIKNIVDELELLYKMGVRNVKFVDDSFIDGDRDEKWAKAFYEEIKSRNINMIFRGSIRADLVTDEIIKYLKLSGFNSFACGIENGSSSALKRMNKSAKIDSNKNALDIFKKYNILVQAGFILFDDKTTLDEIKENYSFLREYNEIIIKGIFSEMFAANGTIFTERLEKQEKIKSVEIYENNKYEIIDEKVKMLYDYIKRWHKIHMRVYDKIVDPISTPKAIDIEAQNQFYDIYMSIKNIDIIFLGYIIDLVEKDYDKDTIESWFIEYDLETRQSYVIADDLSNKLYEHLGLKYDATLNPFVV